MIMSSLLFRGDDAAIHECRTLLFERLITVSRLNSIRSSLVTMTDRFTLPFSSRYQCFLITDFGSDFLSQKCKPHVALSPVSIQLAL